MPKPNRNALNAIAQTTATPTELEFSRLLQRFSLHSMKTGPRDQETLALTYMRRAYELGKEAACAEQTEDQVTEAGHNYPEWQRDQDENDGGSGPEM